MVYSDSRGPRVWQTAKVECSIPIFGSFSSERNLLPIFLKRLEPSGSPAELSVFYNLEKDIFVRKDVLMYAVQTSQAHPASNLLILYTK